ncbi:MAG: protein kinase [Gemmatimonadaceae bacterium]
MTAGRVVPEMADLDGAYDVRQEIGRGGMGVVYLARRRDAGTEVAIKVIHPRSADDAEALARSAREGRTVARLEHPYIVPIHETRQLADGSLALVMEYIPGRTLREAIRTDGAFPIERAVSLLRDIAQALAYAHEQGIVHRDVKPENIFLHERTGRAMLSDFGIARAMESDTYLTMTGAAIGTPAYMSPEQIDGARVDGRSDLYSLALVGWEMLTGKRPWAGESLYSVIYRQKHDFVAPLADARPDAPDNLRYAIEGALLKNRERRHANARELIAQLDGTPHALAVRERLSAEIVAEREAHARGGGDPHSTVTFRRPVEIFSPPEVVRSRRVPRVLAAAAVVLGLLGATAFYVRAVRSRTVSGSPAIALSPVDEGSLRPGGDSALRSSRTARDSARITNERAGSLAPPSRVDTALRIGNDRPAVIDLPVARVPAAESATARERTGGSAIASAARVPPVAPPPQVASASPSTPVASARADSANSGDADPGSAAYVASAVAVGGTHSCMVAGGGVVYCWGGNDRGQLGDGTSSRRPGATRLSGSVRFATLAAGIAHTCGVGRDGGAYCWGANERGQLGDGSLTARAEPARVLDVGGVRSIRAGMAHTCALAVSGDVYCWGANQNGELGDGTTTPRSRAARVPATVKFRALAVGLNHSCALSTDGLAYCWGENGAGQVGDGGTADRALPTPVAGGLRFTAISGGSAHTCGITLDSRLYCWGRNAYGQLGNGATADSRVPARAAGDVAFRSVALGSVHSCALARDGQAYCWGRNTYGQIGDGTQTDRAAPARVQGEHAFSVIQANGAHTCGTSPSGESFCWGYNAEGQLGDGTRIDRARPIYVEKPAGM